MDDEEYRIIEDEPVMPKKVPKAYIILIKNSTLNTKKYYDLLDKYQRAKKNE